MRAVALTDAANKKGKTSCGVFVFYDAKIYICESVSFSMIRFF